MPGMYCIDCRSFDTKYSCVKDALDAEEVRSINSCWCLSWAPCSRCSPVRTAGKLAIGHHSVP